MADAGVQLHRIRITSASIAEVVGRRPLVSIPRAEVRGMRIRHGFITERPWLLAGIGVCVLAFGIVGVSRTALWLMGHTTGRHLQGNLMATAIVALVFGPIALYFALRRGWAVLVDTTTSTRKLGFGARVTNAELSQFVDAARASGVEVEVSAGLPRAAAVRRR